MKDIEPILASGFLFAFLGFLFPTVYDTVQTANASLPEKSLLIGTWIVFIVICAYSFVHYIIKGVS